MLYVTLFLFFVVYFLRVYKLSTPLFLVLEMERLIEFLKEWIKEAEDEEIEGKGKRVYLVSRGEIDGRTSVVHRKALQELSKKRSKNGLIRFSEVNHLLSWLFHLNKKETREFLKEMERAGLIEIVPHNGVRIKMRL